MKVAKLELELTTKSKKTTKMAEPKETWVRKRFRLDERVTRLIMHFRFCLNEEFENGELEESKLWESISEDLKKEAGLVCPAEKCEEKWRSLLTTFQTLLSEGNGGQIKGQEWPYYKTLLIFFKLNKVPVDELRHVRIIQDEPVDFNGEVGDLTMDGTNEVTNLAVVEANEVTNLVVYGDEVNMELDTDELNQVMDVVMNWQNEVKDSEKNDVADLDSSMNEPIEVKKLMDFADGLNDLGVKEANDNKHSGVFQVTEVMEAVHFENEEVKNLVNLANQVDSGVKEAKDVKDLGVFHVTKVMDFAVQGPSPSTNHQESARSDPPAWTKIATKRLIYIRGCMEGEFNKSKQDEDQLKRCWKNISNILTGEFAPYSPEACNRKWTRLLQKYRKNHPGDYYKNPKVVCHCKWEHCHAIRAHTHETEANKTGLTYKLHKMSRQDAATIVVCTYKYPSDTPILNKWEDKCSLDSDDSELEKD